MISSLVIQWRTDETLGLAIQIFRADFSKLKQTSDCRYILPQGFTVILGESYVVAFGSKLIRNKQEMSSHLGAQASIVGMLDLKIA